MIAGDGDLGLYASIAYEAHLEADTPHERSISLKGRSVRASPFFTSPCFGGLEKTQRRRITFYSRGYLAAFVALCAARLRPRPPGFSPGLFLDRQRQVFLARSSPHLLSRTRPRLTRAAKTLSLLVTRTSPSNQRKSQQTLKVQSQTPLAYQTTFLLSQ